MFQLLKRTVNGNTLGNWFPIWSTTDGNDCANYLKQCVEAQPDAHFKMVYNTSLES